ncbi:uncharacterized protein LOC135081161 [Ostrinia nubilalis]|uniref:uncharacterized protein LOC135081161 n=1 Tax=Ostrinia nubilalis TaxID=29057 RepID=UPI00308251EE
MKAKLLVETSILDAEPDLEALVKTPGVMMGEPHVTFPRILAMLWMIVTDPSTTKKLGWCPINRVNKYIAVSKSTQIAKQMRALDPIVARARFIMEEFIQNVTPLNMYQKSTTEIKPSPMPYSRTLKTIKRPIRYYSTSPVSPDFNLDSEFATSEEKWLYRHKKQDALDAACAGIKPSARDIVRRFYAILPYFDKDHSNTAFLHKLRGTIYGMSEGDDVLDREAAFYATVVTPLVFLQQYRDTWCLLERFHRATRLYQISHPTEKRSALKILQNLRAVNLKIRSFIMDLPGPTSVTRTTSPPDFDDDEIHDKKDIKYLKELIKNLG